MPKSDMACPMTESESSIEGCNPFNLPMALLAARTVLEGESKIAGVSMHCSDLPSNIDVAILNMAAIVRATTCVPQHGVYL